MEITGRGEAAICVSEHSEGKPGCVQYKGRTLPVDCKI